MTDRSLEKGNPLSGAIALIKAFVLNPRGIFRTLEADRTARWATGIALVGIILLSGLSGVIFESIPFIQAIYLTSLTVLVLFYVMTLTFYVLLRFLLSWTGGGFTTLALGVALALLPLAFGGIPVIGAFFYLLAFALLLLLIRDHGDVSWFRAVVVMVLAIVVLALVATLLAQMGILGEVEGAA